MSTTTNVSATGNWWDSLAQGAGNFLAPLLASGEARLQQLINPGGSTQLVGYSVQPTLTSNDWLAIAAVIGGGIIIAMLATRRR